MAENVFAIVFIGCSEEGKTALVRLFQDSASMRAGLKSTVRGFARERELLGADEALHWDRDEYANQDGAYLALIEDEKAGTLTRRRTETLSGWTGAYEEKHAELLARFYLCGDLAYESKGLAEAAKQVLEAERVSVRAQTSLHAAQDQIVKLQRENDLLEDELSSLGRESMCLECENIQLDCELRRLESELQQTKIDGKCERAALEIDLEEQQELNADLRAEAARERDQLLEAQDELEGALGEYAQEKLKLLAEIDALKARVRSAAANGDFYEFWNELLETELCKDVEEQAQMNRELEALRAQNAELCKRNAELQEEPHARPQLPSYDIDNFDQVWGQLRLPRFDELPRWSELEDLEDPFADLPPLIEDDEEEKPKRA